MLVAELDNLLNVFVIFLIFVDRYTLTFKLLVPIPEDRIRKPHSSLAEPEVKS